MSRRPVPKLPQDPRNPASPGFRRPGAPAAAAEPAAVFIPGARARTVERRAGVGGDVPRGPALFCAAPPPCAALHTPGAGTPHSRRGPRPAAGCGDWLKGGPPCGKRRHGRSCSVNESKCLGDRGLPSGRHAKGGGGGGEKRAGEGGGEKSQSCSNSVSSTRDVHLPRRARSKGFETD